MHSPGSFTRGRYLGNRHLHSRCDAARGEEQKYGTRRPEKLRGGSYISGIKQKIDQGLALIRAARFLKAPANAGTIASTHVPGGDAVVSNEIHVDGGVGRNRCIHRMRR